MITENGIWTETPFIPSLMRCTNSTMNHCSYSSKFSIQSERFILSKRVRTVEISPDDQIPRTMHSERRWGDDKQQKSQQNALRLMQSVTSPHPLSQWLVLRVTPSAPASRTSPQTPCAVRCRALQTVPAVTLCEARPNAAGHGVAANLLAL